MANINIDTSKVKISGENIKKYAADYNQIVENIFSTLKNLETNEAWVGDSAASSVRKYMEWVSNEKQQYSDFALSINKLGNAIVDYATDVEVISRNNVQGG